MRSTTSILTKIIDDYQQFHFTPSTFYGWNPKTHTIHYNQQTAEDLPSLLHELGHAILRHKDYQKDVELLRMESEAWEKARLLGMAYKIDIPEDAIQNNLDTYRDWLHKKSVCPTCESIGIQQAMTVYHCLNCSGQWTVNEARSCNIRRQLKTAT